MIRRLLIIAALLGLMALAGGADQAGARVAPPPQGWGAATLGVAQDYWGGATPALGCATEAIEWDIPILSSPDTLGEATQPTHPGTACIMRIRAGLDVVTMCYVVVHEYGHWLGYSHSDDPYSVMYPYIRQRASVPGCDALAPHHESRWLNSERFQRDRRGVWHYLSVGKAEGVSTEGS